MNVAVWAIKKQYGFIKRNLQKNVFSGVCPPAMTGRKLDPAPKHKRPQSPTPSDPSRTQMISAFKKNVHLRTIHVYNA